MFADQELILTEALRSTMSNISGLTRGQVRWASEHDWFVDWFMQDGQLVVLVKEVTTCINKDTAIEFKEFNNFIDLKAWAGY